MYKIWWDFPSTTANNNFRLLTSYRRLFCSMVKSTIIVWRYASLVFGWKSNLARWTINLRWCLTLCNVSMGIVGSHKSLALLLGCFGASVEWRYNANVKAISKWISAPCREIYCMATTITTNTIGHKIHYNFPTKAFHVYANVGEEFVPSDVVVLSLLQLSNLFRSWASDSYRWYYSNVLYYGQIYTHTHTHNSRRPKWFSGKIH